MAETRLEGGFWAVANILHTDTGADFMSVFTTLSALTCALF